MKKWKAIETQEVKNLENTRVVFNFITIHPQLLIINT